MVTVHRVQRLRPELGVRDATPDGFDVGTSLHAYGGGAYVSTPTALVVVNANDQPPNQAEAIIAALRQRAVPVTELTFPGEGHGLRRTDSIHRALEAELTFHRAALNLRS